MFHLVSLSVARLLASELVPTGYRQTTEDPTSVSIDSRPSHDDKQQRQHKLSSKNDKSREGKKHQIIKMMPFFVFLLISTSCNWRFAAAMTSTGQRRCPKYRRRPARLFISYLSFFSRRHWCFHWWKPSRITIWNPNGTSIGCRWWWSWV